MKRFFILLLLCCLLCGCAAAGSLDQGAAPSNSTQAPPQATAATVPGGTIAKNPGLTLDPYDPKDQVPEITENRIRKDYCDAHPSVSMDDVRLRIMGVFEETYVLFVDVKGMMYAEVITEENVGGIRFFYSNSHKMQVWHDGRFYSLMEAYDAGLLTKQDLQRLSQDYYQANPHLIPVSPTK